MSFERKKKKKEENIQYNIFEEHKFISNIYKYLSYINYYMFTYVTVFIFIIVNSSYI